MSYAPYSFKVFKVKNLDVDCDLDFDTRDPYQDGKTAGCRVREVPNAFEQLSDINLSVTAYLNGDIKKFRYSLGRTKEEIRDRICDFIEMCTIFGYEVRSKTSEYNGILDRLYKNLFIDWPKDDDSIPVEIS